MIYVWLLGIIVNAALFGAGVVWVSVGQGAWITPLVVNAVATVFASVWLFREVSN